LEALASGTVTPITPEQHRFVRVARGEEVPRSAFEVAWDKHRRSIADSDPRIGPLELAAHFDEVQRAKEAAAATREEYETKREGIMEQVQPQLEALEAEFADRLKTTQTELARLETEARQAVLTYGASFRHAGVQAVFTRGRTTWDSKGLSHYMTNHPEVGQFRRVGEPSVSIRYRPPGKTASLKEQASPTAAEDRRA
jgi:hypothetical protein